MSDTSREGEDCLLARHPECNGKVVLGSSPNARIEVACQCECHRPR